MAEGPHKSLKVLIAGRHYPVIIEDENEQLIEEVVNDLNSKLKEFQATYHNKDIQDCLAMLLLSNAVDSRKHKSIQYEQGELSEKLDQINLLLDKAIS